MANIKRNPTQTQIGEGRGGVGTPDVTINPIRQDNVAVPISAKPGIGADIYPVAAGDEQVGNKPNVPGAGAAAGAVAGALPATGAITPPEPAPAPTPAPTPAPSTPEPVQPSVDPNVNQGGVLGGNAVVLPMANDYSDMINELYAMQQEQMLAQAQSRYDAAIAELNRNQAKIPGYYQEAARQNAGQNAIERRAMNEQFAATGLNTGAAGQASLAQSIASQGEQAAIRKAEADALSEIEFSRAQMMAEYQAAVRDAILSNNIAKAEALYNEALRLDEAAVQNALNQAQLDYQARMEELAALEARAEMLASIGDYSGYAALGYSPEEIAALEAAWQKANAGYTGGGGYTGTTYDTHGMTTAEIMELQKAAGITVDGIWGPQTQAAYEAMMGAATPGGEAAAPGEAGQQAQGTQQPLGSSHAQVLYGAIVNGTMDTDSIYSLLEYYSSAGLISKEESEYLLWIMGY